MNPEELPGNTIFEHTMNDSVLIDSRSYYLRKSAAGRLDIKTTLKLKKFFLENINILTVQVLADSSTSFALAAQSLAIGILNGDEET